MRILRIHINNLNSLRLQTSIDFEQAPLSQADIFAITGNTGAGKTTILDAITLALYGRVARNKDAHKEVMSYGAVECHAEVEFVVDGDQYLASWRMHRARHKPEGNLLAPQRELAKWDTKEKAFRAIAEKVREVDEAVRELTKLDFERFTRSVMLAQGDFAAFLKASDKERSDLLERITGTGIYSELSSAAFERYRQEEQQLKELQVQQEQLVLLGEETVTEEQLTEARKLVKVKTKALEAIQQQVQLLDRRLAAQTRMQALENEQVQLKEEERSFATQAQALSHSKQLSPLRSQFQSWDFQQAQQAAIQQKAKQMAVALTQAQQEYTKLEVETTAAATTFQEAKENGKARKVQIEIAATLDEKFRHLDKQWQAENEQLQELQAELQQQEQAQQEQEQQLQTQQQEQEQLADWLQKHNQYRELPTVFPVIDQERTQLRERYLSQQKLQKKQEELQTTSSEWKRKTKLLEKSYEQQDKALHGLHQKVNQLLPEMFSTTEEAGIERLGDAIQDLQDKRAILQQLVQLDEAYQKSLREQEAYAERLEGLLNRQQFFNKELLNLVERREQQQEELDYRRAIYQQQQLIVNYEKDRRQLKPGDPCPLCLSTDHPFHEHTVEPFVDKAQRDFASAEKQMQEVLKSEKEFLQQEGKINQEIELLYSDEEKSNMRQVQRRILEYESQIAGLLNTQKDSNWAAERGQRLGMHLSQLDEQIQHWRQLQKELTALSRQIGTHTAELQETERNYLENKRQFSVAEAEQQVVQANLEEEVEQFMAAQVLMNEKLTPLGEQFELSAAKETFARLETLTQTVSQKLNRQSELKQMLKVTGVQSVTLIKSLSKLQKQVEKQTVKSDKLAQERNNCQQERTATLGEQTVSAARMALEQALERAEGEWQRSREAQQKQKEQLLTQQERLAENKKQANANTKELTKVQTRLTNALQKTDFAQLADARSVLLSEKEQAELEAEQQRILQAIVQNTKALQNAQQELKKLEPKTKTEETQEQLRQQLQEKQLDYEEQLLQLGQLEEKYQQKQDREKRHQVLLQQIEAQRQGFNRWAQLNEVIGQRDGKKFRSFAQGLTLQRLIVLANQHLDRLNGRYFVAKKENTDLELEIIDTFQAENRRSVFTLSGGETFLISLALALGLSDLAGRHAQIQSLFIDEGFGTLDEHSLDLAISTLENLRAGGKTIGIISHVKALKERIGTQIRLHKQSDGFSNISVQA